MPQSKRERVSVRKAMELTTYSRQMIYNVLVSGRVKAIKDGHFYLIDLESLMKYYHAHRGRRVQDAAAPVAEQAVG
jgi:hypothetical protein